MKGTNRSESTPRIHRRAAEGLVGFLQESCQRMPPDQLSRRHIEADMTAPWPGVVVAPGLTEVDHSRMRLVELSHPVEHGMTTYPGLPGPVIGEHMSFDDSAGRYDAGTEFTIGSITMVGNTGTYLDTPGHRFRGGHDLAGLALERCALLPAVVVDATSVRAGIDAADLPAEGLAGAAVLLHTGWDRHWRTERYGDSDHPFLTAAGATALVRAEVALVGIDAVNIDSTVGGARPAHTELLGAGIPIVEHLTGLDGLPARGATFTAVPAPIRGLYTFPVRAFARLP